MYRITIELLKPQDEPGAYDSWKEVYQQQIADLDIPALVTIINTPK